MFIGEFEAKIDTQGRFLLPLVVRNQLVVKDFVLNRGFNSAINLYPLPAWESYLNDLMQLDTNNNEVRAYKRIVLNGATPVELDSTGRILLPKMLLEYANIQKDIVILGLKNYFEIFDTHTYLKFLEDNSGYLPEL